MTFLHHRCAGGFELHGGAALLRSVAVEPRARSRGLASVLVERVLDAARAAGATDVHLLTETAEAFFARREFRRIEQAAVPPELQRSAELRGACPDTAIVMWRPL